MQQNGRPYDFSEMRKALDNIELHPGMSRSEPQVGNSSLVSIKPRLTEIPQEIRFMIWKLLLPFDLNLEVNPASKPCSMPSNKFWRQQLSRLVFAEANFTNGSVSIQSHERFTSPDEEREADDMIRASWSAWANSTAEDPTQDVLNARATSRFMNDDILKALSTTNIPIVLTAPGIPRLDSMRLWQRNFASVSSTLIFRHRLFRTHIISAYVERNPQVDLLVSPPVWIGLDHSHHWDGFRLEEGIMLGDIRAYQYLQNLLRDFIPDMRVSEGANKRLRWVGEVLVSIHKPTPISEFQTTKCIVAKDVGPRANPLIILGIRTSHSAVFTTPKISSHGLISLSRWHRAMEQAEHQTQHDPSHRHPKIARDFLLTYEASRLVRTTDQIITQGRLKQDFDLWYDSIPAYALNLNLWFDEESELRYWKLRV